MKKTPTLCMLMACMALTIPTVARAASGSVTWQVIGASQATEELVTLQLDIAPIADPDAGDNIEIVFAHPHGSDFEPALSGSPATSTIRLPATCSPDTISQIYDNFATVSGYDFTGDGIPESGEWIRWEPWTSGPDVVEDFLQIDCETILEDEDLPGGAVRYVFRIGRSSAVGSVNETWQISVASGSSGQFLQGCLTADPGNTSDSGFDAYIATLPGEERPGDGCLEEEPPVSAVLVLDKSGSMTEVPSGWGRSKMSVMETAIGDLLGVWQLRHPFDTPMSFRDRVGIRYFDSMASNPPSGPTGLSVIAPSAGTDQFDPWLGSNFAMPGGSTSIGAGVEAGLNLLDTAPMDHRRTMVVVSDGKENAYPNVACEEVDRSIPADADYPFDYRCALTFAPDDGRPDMPIIDRVDRISTITVGTPGTIEPFINQALAQSTGGIYLGDDLLDDAPSAGALLRLHFLGILEDYLQFNTIALTHIEELTASTTSTAETTFTVGTTAKTPTVSILVPENAYTSVRFTPPGNHEPIDAYGFDRITQELPPIAGQWRVRVSPYAPQFDVVPVAVVAMDDDDVVHAEFETRTLRPTPGDEIVLQTRLTGADDRPIAADADDVVAVDVRVPAQSIGDLLATYPAQQRDPSFVPDDAYSVVLAALEARRRAGDDSPLSFTLRRELRDDGNGPDDVAGDGIYSGSFFATAPGSYELSYDIRITQNEGLTFSRTETITIAVQPVPDPQETEFEDRVVDGVRLITMTPRTTGGYLVGPYWRNYFVADYEGNRLRFNDLGDGSYRLGLPENLEGPVEIGFYDGLTNVTDEVWRSGRISDLEVETLAGGGMRGDDFLWFVCAVDPDHDGRGGALLLLALLGLGVGTRRRRRANA